MTYCNWRGPRTSHVPSVEKAVCNAARSGCVVRHKTLLIIFDPRAAGIIDAPPGLSATKTGSMAVRKLSSDSHTLLIRTHATPGTHPFGEGIHDVGTVCV